MTTLRIATRGSQLALWQAHHIRDRLCSNDPALTVELVVIKTTGDKILDRPLAQVGGKGLFVKEIEEALLDGRADLAVHSMKDVPSELPPGLGLVCVPEREDPRDALLVAPSGTAKTLGELPRGARVGTSSLRRMSQIHAQRPDVVIDPLRGNVDTRLRKLDEGQHDAIVLAAAGLKRLGFAARITSLLAPTEMLPAIGQGALAIEAREDDTPLRGRLSQLHSRDTADAVAAERAFLARMGGSCRTPLAAYATFDRAGGDRLTLEALVGRPDGTRVLRERLEGRRDEASHLGSELAERLIRNGGDVILRECVTVEPVGGA